MVYVKVCNIQVQHPTVLIRPLENEMPSLDPLSALVRAVTRHR